MSYVSLHVKLDHRSHEGVSWFLHMELSQLVSSLLIYLNYVLSIVVTFPAKSKIPVTFHIAEGLRSIFEGCRLFVPNYVSPPVNLNCSSSVFSFRGDDKVDEVVFFKQTDILGSKIVTIHNNKLVSI